MHSSTAVVALVAFACAAHAYENRDAVPRASWHHPAGHPVERLFKRDHKRATPPAVGSPAWTAQYPDPGNFPPKNLPQSWVDTMNAAIAAKKIPDIPIPTLGPAGSPVYPTGFSPTGSQVCSATYECRAPGDIWDAPDGTVALAFDDGPLPPSPRLYDFLKQNAVHATHFFIGGNILYNSKIFLQAFQDNQDPIAVHTYTHPYMTLQSNAGVLAELGYTMQIIYDSTGGLVPKFWRPPYGDADNRVRAIAKEVFGLTTVIWNQDSSDWELTYGAIPLSTVEASLTSFYKLPKSPGLIILEHELSDNSVNAFINSWGIMHSENWEVSTIPNAANVTTDPGYAWYQNAGNDTAAIESMSFGTGPESQSSVAPSSTSSAAPGTSTGTGTNSASGGTKSGITTTLKSSGTTTSTSTTTATTGAALRSASSSAPAMLLLGGIAALFVHFG